MFGEIENQQEQSHFGCSASTDTVADGWEPCLAEAQVLDGLGVRILFVDELAGQR